MAVMANSIRTLESVGVSRDILGESLPACRNSIGSIEDDASDTFEAGNEPPVRPPTPAIEIRNLKLASAGIPNARLSMGYARGFEPIFPDPTRETVADMTHLGGSNEFEILAFYVCAPSCGFFVGGTNGE